MPLPRSAMAAIAIAVLTSCGSGAAAPRSDHRAVPPGTPATSDDPARLVGAWHLRAPGEPHTAILTIGDRVDGGLLLFRPCGMLSGSWAANRRAMFVGALDGGDGDCFTGRSNPRSVFPAWLTRVTGFRSAPPAVQLLDAAGAVVATLTPGAKPLVGPNDSPEFAEPPVVTADMRRSWRTPAPLPASVRAATTRDIVGRWVPDDTTHPSSKAYVEFQAGGRYGGSDGCNGVGGRYLLGADGVVLATTGPQTAVGCENNRLPSWVGMSGRLGIRDGRLVFVDPRGTVLGDARRAA